MGHHEVVIDLEQGQLIPQACFALAQCIDPAPDCRHPLTDIEVEALHTSSIDGPAPSRQDLLDSQPGAEDHLVLDADEPPPSYRLHHLRVEQTGQWHPPRLRYGAFVLAPFGLHPMAKTGQESGPILF